MTTFDPDWCMRPGVFLQELLDDAGLTNTVGITMVARLSGLTPEAVRGILAGEVEITEEIAGRLAAGTSPLRVSAGFWLNAERIYRAGLAAGKKDVSDD